MKKLLMFIGLAMFSTLVSADVWKVNNDASTVSFISIKKGDVAEVHYFNQISGELQQDEFTLNIPLTSVDTNIEVRDQRMRSMLFEVAKFPELELKAKIEQELVPTMAVGEQSQYSIDAQIQLHGKSQPLTIDVIVAKLSDSKLLVTSVQPVIIRADAFDLGGGIDKLRQIASLSSISWAVPVSFVLVLNK